MARRRSLLFGIGQLLVAVAGVGFGSVVGHPGDPPHLFTLLGVLAVLLLAVGTVAQPRAEPPHVRWVGSAVSAVAAFYCCATMVAEPFLDPPRNVAELLPLVAWLVPILLAGMGLARLGNWRGAAGASVFLFACVALMTFNMQWLDMAGFLVKIRR